MSETGLYCEACNQRFVKMLEHTEPHEDACPLCGADEGAVEAVAEVAE